MVIAPIPHDEVDRQKALSELQILDTASET
jgi:hypothetical protein